MPLETLSKYTPTELEKIVESPCPFYIPRKRVFSGIYAPAHELATNLLAVKLQQKLKELQLKVSTEQPLKNINGRLDLKITKGKIRLKNSGKTLAIVEIKTGGLKLVQPACYALSEQVDVLLVSFKTGEMQIVTPETAEKLLTKIKESLEKKEELKEENMAIPCNTCSKCANEECGYCVGETEKEKFEISSKIYQEKIEKICENLDIICSKIIEYLKDKLEKEEEEVKAEIEAEAEVMVEEIL